MTATISHPMTATTTTTNSLTLGDRVLADWRMHDAMRSGLPADPNHHGMTPGARVREVDWNPLTLEEVRDDARRRAEQENAVDVVRSLRTWHVDYRGHADLPQGRLAARYMTAGGWSDPMPMTRRALAQWARDVLPSHGLGYHDRLAALGDDGKALATMAGAMFAQATPPRARRVRLYDRADVDGVTRPTVRAVVSEGYGVYSDLELLEALLSDASLAQLPVLSYRVTDGAMRVRLAMDPLDGPPAVGVPVPMVEAWNSPVGASAVALKGGLWTLHCTNGMAGWSDTLVRRWNHSGNMDRVREGVPQALDEMRLTAAGMVDRYRDALGVAVSDAMAWMDRQLADVLTAAQLSAAQAHLQDPAASTAPVGSLARVVDAVSYTAHGQWDPMSAEVVEQAAGRLLTTGLSQADGGRLVVPQD